MLSRALVPIVLCVSATWPLRALACLNSMDSSAITVRQPLWLDLVTWTVGAVFMNGVVFVNLREPISGTQSRLARLRRAFFQVTAACILLLLTAVMAGGPLLSIGVIGPSRCSPSTALLLILFAAPLVLFTLQSVSYQVVRYRSSSTAGPFVGLVLTSLLLASVMVLARNELLLPLLCEEASRY